jgi:hypothetical protein
MNTEELMPRASLKLLNKYLSDIYDLGDRDEMSVKHVGHGMASVLAFDSWRKCVDYTEPDYPLTVARRRKLADLWELVEDLVKLEGKQWVLDVLPILEANNYKMLYVNTYTGDTWLGYGTEIKKQNLSVKER